MWKAVTVRTSRSGTTIMQTGQYIIILSYFSDYVG
jgi:hypothetical protein